MPSVMSLDGLYADDNGDTPSSAATVVQRDSIPVLCPLERTQSPLNTFPPNLLQTIFRLYLDDSDTNATPGASNISGVWSQRNSRISPLITGQVCKQWRYLSQSTPSLWTSIAVIDPQAQDLALLSSFLRLSRGLPLQLDLVQEHGHSRESDLAMAKIIEMLCHESHRWKHVRLGVYPSNLIHPGSTPILESYTLDLKSAWNSKQLNYIYDQLGSSSPLLQAVAFESVHDLPTFGIPWSQLQSLSLHCVSHIRQLYPILPQCISLETLRIDILDEWVGKPRRIALPRLRTLTVGDIDQLKSFLQCLHTPALENLTLRYGFRESNGFDAITQLLDRSSGLSSHGLKSLSWREEPDIILPDALISFFRHPALEELEELELHFPVSDAFLEALQGNYSGTNARNQGGTRGCMGFRRLRTSARPILTQLKRLVLGDVGMERCSAARLGTLAQVRFESHAPESGRASLDSLKIYRPGPDASDSSVERQWLGGIQRAGKDEGEDDAELRRLIEGIQNMKVVVEDAKENEYASRVYTITVPERVTITS